MAERVEHNHAELAIRLEDYADSIENPGAHEAEKDIREAARLLREMPAPPPLIPRLVGALSRLSTFSKDADTRRELRLMLGEPQ